VPAEAGRAFQGPEWGQRLASLGVWVAKAGKRACRKFKIDFWRPLSLALQLSLDKKALDDRIIWKDCKERNMI
jgi:hypothetical protein